MITPRSGAIPANRYPPGKAAWDVRRQSSTGSTTQAAAGAQEQVIPVYEEELKVGKRQVEQGQVRVRVYTVQHPVQEGVTLREERGAVERRPADRRMSKVPGDAFQERTLDVTTNREEPVVAKEARPKEEPRPKGSRSAHLNRADIVRHSEIEVEDDRATASTPPASPPRDRAARSIQGAGPARRRTCSFHCGRVPVHVS